MTLNLNRKTKAANPKSLSMRTNTRTQPRNIVRRRGVASAELAVVLSTLMVICLATCDYARCIFASVTVANCARNGALYQCDPAFAATTSYATLQAAVQADAGNLSPAPTGSSTTSTDTNGNKYVAVTVTYPFQCLINYPGIPDSFTISRTVSMAVAPTP
jgi:Flp pilus assembly protein TadG